MAPDERAKRMITLIKASYEEYPDKDLDGPRMAKLIEEEFYNCEWSAVENWSKFEVRK